MSSITKKSPLLEAEIDHNNTKIRNLKQELRTLEALAHGLQKQMNELNIHNQQLRIAIYKDEYSFGKRIVDYISTFQIYTPKSGDQFSDYFHQHEVDTFIDIRNNYREFETKCKSGLINDISCQNLKTKILEMEKKYCIDIFHHLYPI